MSKVDSQILTSALENLSISNHWHSMPSPPPPSAIALLYYAFTVVLISSALAVHSTSSFLFGPLPSLSTQSLVSSATTGLTCRGNGAKLEHLTGECMSQFECVQQSGLSLGPCSMHHALGSCCLLKSTTVQSKQSWRDQTVIMPYSTRLFLVCHCFLYKLTNFFVCFVFLN